MLVRLLKMKDYFQNSMTNMHYNDTSKVRVELAYLYGLTRLGIKPGLATMEQLMEALGHPEKQWRSIHVTGTNGKGSTCAMMESVLREAGYRTALYTSPHLYLFNERIQINRVSISDIDLAVLVQEIREVCERENIHPTFFEFTTALAFLYFSRADIDIAVIEVGMGGRCDATNVITPLVSVITNVGLDHTEYFGPTKHHVAREKSGIIKEGGIVVTNEQDPQMLKIFHDAAQEKNTTLIRVGDIVNANVVSADLDGQVVDVQFSDAYLTSVSTNPLQPCLAGRQVPLTKGESTRVTPPYVRQLAERGRGGSSSLHVHLPLLGLHQVENMKTAITAMTILHPLILTFSPSGEKGTLTSHAIVSGIAKTIWEGRLQVLSKTPLIIIDGAHNGEGAQALGSFLRGLRHFDVLVFATKRNKDISDMLTHVIPLCSRVIVTEGSYMPESANMISDTIRKIGKEVIVEPSPGKAFDLAKSLIDSHGTILVTGSLYMVADVLAHVRTSKV